MLNLFGKFYCNRQKKESKKVFEEVANYDNSLENSRILSVCLMDEEIKPIVAVEQIYEWLPKQNSTFKLHYRATRDGFSAQNFYDKCMGKSVSIYKS